MKKYYLRDRDKTVPELEFDSLGLARQVAKAMAQTYPIGNYSTMYVVQADGHQAIVAFMGSNEIIFAPNEKNWK